MPVVKFIVTKSYLRRVEALAKKRGFKDASEWERSKVRAYLAGEPPSNPGIIRLYAQWEDLEEIIDIRTGKPFHVRFDQAKVLPLSNGEKPGRGEALRAATLTGKMAEWLQKGVAFSKEAVRQLNTIKGLPKQFEGIESRSSSVSEFLSLYLQGEVREGQVQAEIQELDK